MKPEFRRAYSTFEVKAINEEQRLVEGVASTPEPDRLGDVVEPKGAVFKLPLPLLWQHNSAKPVGEVQKAKVTRDGITVVAKIFKAMHPAPLVERLDEAWESVKMGLVKGFSIGFSPREYEQIDDTYSLRFKEWEWLELSLVTIPANASATISAVKSIDQEALRAASGRRFPVVKLGDDLLRRARRDSRPGVFYLR